MLNVEILPLDSLNKVLGLYRLPLWQWSAKVGDRTRVTVNAKFKVTTED